MTRLPAQSPIEEDPDAVRRVVLSTAPFAELRLQRGRVELALGTGAATRVQIVNDETHVQLEFGRFRSLLQLGALSVSLNAARLKEALALIALGRVSGGTLPEVAADHWLQDVSDSVFVVGLDSLSRMQLLNLLGPDEWPLAWLPTTHELTGSSRVLGPWRSPANYLLTEQRHLLVASSVLGALEELPLPKASLECRQRRIEIGDLSWKSSERALFATLRELPTLPPGKRVLAIAKEQSLRERPSPPVVAPLMAPERAPHHWLLRLLTRAANAGEPSAAILRRLHKPGFGQTREDWTHSELDEDLAALCTNWKLEPKRSRQLLEALPREPLAMNAATSLAKRLWEDELERSSSPVDAAHADMRYAELLYEFGRTAEATELLGVRRASWPPLQLADLELPIQLTPTPERTARRQLEQLAVKAAAGEARMQIPALLRLQQLDPLNPQWLLDLSRLADTPLAARAARAHRLLFGPTHGEAGQVHDLVDRTRGSPAPSPLSAEDWSLLSDPLATNQKRLLTRIQTFIAKTESPDFATLKLYCERITQDDSPVTRAVDHAATLLGLGHTDVYVSRGHDDVGVRAFQHKSPILLIGSQHVDPRSRFFMQEQQLLFAVSSELAHVRLGHARVAPKHVLRGALDKSRQGLDLALSVLPILKGFALANRLGMATAKLSLPQVGKAMNAARALSGAVKSDRAGAASERSDIALANEELLLAHRLMQLNADRVGLLCCQDLAVAASAIMLGRSDYVRATNDAAALGALAAVNKQRQGNADAYDDLLLRLGALVSFYVSDAFVLLGRSRPGSAA